MACEGQKPTGGNPPLSQVPGGPPVRLPSPQDRHHLVQPGTRPWRSGQCQRPLRRMVELGGMRPRPRQRADGVEGLGAARWGSFPRPAQGPDPEAAVRAGSGLGTPGWTWSPLPHVRGLGHLEISQDGGRPSSAQMMDAFLLRPPPASIWTLPIPSLGGEEGEDLDTHWGKSLHGPPC